jgi:hypothetical protein
MNETRLSLKEFTEQYINILNSLSHDELKLVISAMAEETLPSERQKFLNKFLRYNRHEALLSTDNGNSENLIATYEKDILDDIEALKEEIKSRGSDEPDWNDYDDEDALSGYEDLVPEVSELLDKIEALYDCGNYTLAKTAYHELFAIFSIEDDYGRGIRIYDVADIDKGEVIAKALRSNYLSETSPYSRVITILMLIHEYCEYHRVTLKDLIGISIDPLPEFEQFLTLWINALNDAVDLSDNNHILAPYNDMLLREAVFLQNGISGLENLARSNGVNCPMVFLDWIDELIKVSDYNDAIAAANYALKVLAKDKPIRAAIADKLLYCGQQINNTDIVDSAAWISFAAKPDLTKLVVLFHQSVRSNQHALILSTINTIKHHIDKPYKGAYYEEERPARPTQSLLMYAYLLSGEIAQAFNLAKVHKSLGWSYGENPQPVFISYCFMQMTLSASQSIDKLPPALQQFLKSNLDSEIFALLKQSMPLLLTPEMVEWCLKITDDRVKAIVSNQHRRAYSKAALLAAACAEAIKLSDKTKAISFFTGIQGSYPRHSAFQTEMKQFIKSIVE